MKKDKKQRVTMGIGIFTLLLVIIGASYAYFVANMGTGTSANINANTGTTDSLSFNTGEDVFLLATVENFKKGGNHLVGSTIATATLKANNTTNEARGKYNVFFIIETNDFEYSTENGQTELLLKATDPNGNEVTSITGLKKVENGFDITTRTGGFLIAKDYEIETTSTTEQTWQVEVTLINLETNQKINFGKRLSAKFLITTSEEATYELAKINSIEAVTKHNSITANLNTMVGTSEIDKYYYAIQEDTSAVALLGFSKVARLAEKELNYIESDEPTYTFDNLKPNTSYKVYSYAKDKEGIISNLYETKITTEEYVLPKVTGLTHTSDFHKITVTATATKGTNEISKYYFSKDNGSSWSEGQTLSTYVFDNLLEGTEYKIKVKVSDTENKYSTEYYEAITTLVAPLLSEKIISTYGTDTNLLHHDSSLANGAGDNSYRYAGANPNNYVCFGSTESSCLSANLYRIIGVFGSQVKLIHATYVTTAEIGTAAQGFDNWFYWSGSSNNTSNEWSSSTLNTSSLNGTFLTNLGATWTNKIAQTTWNTSGGTPDNLQFSNAKTAYDYEVGTNKSTAAYSAKIGLPYISEYYYAATSNYWTYPGYDTTENGNDYRKSIENNWMVIGKNYWTISCALGASNRAFRVSNEVNTSNDYVHTYHYIRPVFNLVSSVKTSGGSGTQSDPYRIKI